MEHEVTLAGLTLAHPLVTAAGTARTIADARKLARGAEVSMITFGSYTADPRQGNHGNVFLSDEPIGPLNSLGMPNGGEPFLRANLREMIDIIHAAGKRVCVSVAGPEPADYARLAELAFECGADMVELNFGCPNVWDGGVQKEIISYQPSAMFKILAMVNTCVGQGARVAVKLSPISSPRMLADVATVINEEQLVKVIVTSNTFPNAWRCDANGHPRITPPEGQGTCGGYGGMSGPAMLGIGQGQVHQFRHLLLPPIHIIGVGGVSTGRDVFDYLRAGADAVGLATAYLRREDPGVFSRIMVEYVELTTAKSLP